MNGVLALLAVVALLGCFPMASATTSCAGEFEQCPTTNDCVLIPEDCGKCPAGQYLCPSRIKGLCRTLYSRCPDLRGTFWDWRMSPTKRAKLVVKAMNLDEKITQLRNNALSVPRLNIPHYNWLDDDLHGVLKPGATSFPDGIGLGATWDPRTVKEVGRAIGVEARAFHNSAAHLNERARHRQNGYGVTIYGPNINIVRDPRWGRCQETYGEDPKLTSDISAAYVSGMQESKFGYNQAAACCKHFAAYDLDSNPIGRVFFDAVVDGRNMQETYLAAFENCVRKGGAMHVMCSYNSINGVPTCGDEKLLNGVLRDRWGFEGFVVSDYDAMANIYTTHKYCPNMTCAGATALNAGCDQEGGGHAAVDTLPMALNEGLVNISTINRAVYRLFRARIDLGLLDPPDIVPFATWGTDMMSSTSHMVLNLHVARQSIALYRNRYAQQPTLAAPLPLSNKSVATVAVIGPNAAATTWLQGNYGRPVNASMVSMLEGITNAFAAPGNCSMEADVSYGPSMRVVEAASASDCAQQCTKDLACNFFTFDGGEKCNKYPSMPLWNRRHVRGHVSGARFGLCIVAQDVDYSAPSDVPTRAQDYRECCQLCRANATCNFFTFIQGGGYPQYKGSCFLKASDAARHTTAGAVSGTSSAKVPGVGYAPGCLDGMQCQNTGGFAAATALANRSDVVVLVLGLDEVIEHEGHDRPTIDLPDNQYALFKAVRARVTAPRKLVVVLVHGGTVALKDLQSESNGPDALLDAWYPSQQGGNAVADVLFGRYNPGSRAHTTYYASNADLPPTLDAMDLYPNATYNGLTYRYFNGTATPPVTFGYGLSYTTFQYSAMSVSPEVPKTCENIVVTLTLKNMGSMAGEEVVQVYVQQFNASVPVPRIRLAAFSRVPVPAYGAVRVGLIIEPQFHSAVLVNTHGRGVYDAHNTVEEGPIRIFVAGGQPGHVPHTSNYGQALEQVVTVKGHC